MKRKKKGSQAEQPKVVSQKGAPGGAWLQAALILCLIGVGLSAELTRIHFLSHTVPDFHALCAVNEAVNCETVALSPYSVFAGLPVSVFGLIGYLVMAALAAWGLSRRRLHATWPAGGLFGLFVLSAAVSAVLGYVSVTRIDSVCQYCVGTYVINASLVVLGVLILKKANKGPVRAVLDDISAALRRPVLCLMLAVFGGALLAGVYAKVDPYWAAPGWSDIPKLASGLDDEGHHWIGAKKPELTIVEFSDYECPHCRRAHKDARLIAARFPDRVRLIHRHLPLDAACHPLLERRFHERACEFAAAAECAGRQGMFWEMNDALFSLQDRIKAKDIHLKTLAVQLGLGRQEFATCLDSRQTAGEISDDLAAAVEKKLQGTPTFFIGEEKFLGHLPTQRVEELLRGKSVRAER